VLPPVGRSAGGQEVERSTCADREWGIEGGDDLEWYEDIDLRQFRHQCRFTDTRESDESHTRNTRSRHIETQSWSTSTSSGRVDKLSSKLGQLGYNVSLAR
jgi:hypothetical protein